MRGFPDHMNERSIRPDCAGTREALQRFCTIECHTYLVLRRKNELNNENVIKVLSIGVCIGLCGFSVALTFQEFDGGLIVFACLGAFLAGLICSPLFGKAGIAGVATAILGGIFATILGSMTSIVALLLFTGGLFSQLFGLLPIGVGLVLAAIVTQPITLSVWFTFMGAAHLAAVLLNKWAEKTPHWSERN